MNVTTRSYSPSRSGANLQETHLTPANVGRNLLFKRFSLVFNDDPRLEAQPLYVSGFEMNDNKVHDVVYICTMANNVWAFDAKTGKPIWAKPTSLGKPISPVGTEIDLHQINKLWGILSTPVLDLGPTVDNTANKMYVVCWTSPSGKVVDAFHELHRVDLKTGKDEKAVKIDSATPAGQPQPGPGAPQFIPSKQKQRSSLLMVKDPASGKETLLVPFGMTHEEGDPTHGWLLAFDVESMELTASWCTSAGGHGAGIWQAGQGPAADDKGDIYCMTGNYTIADAGQVRVPVAGDLPQSFVKLHYTPASAAAAASLAPVAWFTPFQDHQRSKTTEDDFRDYDLGSAGPLFLTGLNLVVGAGKDGVLYVLSSDTASMGQGSDLTRLKQPPIFFTYFPGFGIDAANVANLDTLFQGKTHHLHCSPAYWDGSAGPQLFCWGENECLRAWSISPAGVTTFVAKSAEVASAGAPGKGGMPGGILCVSSNGNKAGTGIVWATAPISGDANANPVEGILRAYDASVLDRTPNADGSPKLKLLWHSDQDPQNSFTFCKFCPPFVADGQVFVPTYDGRVDVYGLKAIPPGPKPTNARF
jgi:outer membrane protein assembly factor BamB